MQGAAQHKRCRHFPVARDLPQPRIFRAGIRPRQSQRFLGTFRPELGGDKMPRLSHFSVASQIVQLENDLSVCRRSASRTRRGRIFGRSRLPCHSSAPCMMTMDRIADQAQRITSPVVAQPAHRDFAPPLILSGRFAICREARMVRDGEPCGPNVCLRFCF